jgi:hypothetical protein
MNQRVRFASREPALGWIGGLANSPAAAGASRVEARDFRSEDVMTAVNVDGRQHVLFPITPDGGR